jgi:hypothetical protein
MVTRSVEGGRAFGVEGRRVAWDGEGTRISARRRGSKIGCGADGGIEVWRARAWLVLESPPAEKTRPDSSLSRELSVLRAAKLENLGTRESGTASNDEQIPRIASWRAVLAMVRALHHGGRRGCKAENSRWSGGHSTARLGKRARFRVASSSAARRSVSCSVCGVRGLRASKSVATTVPVAVRLTSCCVGGLFFFGG